MKIIQVVGRSGSGKTTFIRKLCTVLGDSGQTGTIKHLGHHRFLLTPGKDTTLFFETGIRASIGIDDEKTVRTERTTSLHLALCSLADRGVEYAIIEGFKDHPYSRIVIGELQTDALLRNPEVSDVVDSLALFDDFYTLQSLYDSHIKKELPPSPVLSLLLPVQKTPNQSSEEKQIESVINAVSEKYKKQSVRIRYPVYHSETPCPHIGIVIMDSQAVDTGCISVVVSDIRDGVSRAGLQIPLFWESHL